jgi:hypothetical protein
MVEQQGRAELADRRGAEALCPRHSQNGVFVQIIAVEVLIDVVEHGIVFDEGDDGVARRHRRIASVEGVTERAGIAEIMPACHRRAVGHS